MRTLGAGRLVDSTNDQQEQVQTHSPARQPIVPLHPGPCCLQKSRQASAAPEPQQCGPIARSMGLAGASRLLHTRASLAARTWARSSPQPAATAGLAALAASEA